MSCAEWTTHELGRAGEEHALALVRTKLPKGFTASPTTVNFANVDIIVNDPSGNSVVDLQVKTRCSETNRNWTLSARHEPIVAERLFYCLLAFDGIQSDQVRYWIVPSKVVADCVRETHEAYQAQTGKNNNRRHIREDMSARLPKYGAGWMCVYRDRWDLLSLGAYRSNK